MTRTDFRGGLRHGDRRTRWGVAVAVLLLHLALVIALIRAFTPGLADSMVRSVTQAFTVTVEPSPEPPEPEPAPVPELTPAPAPAPEAPAKQAQGSAGSAGRQARPRAVAAPRPAIVISPTQAPPVAGTGAENASGARDDGAGTGAAGSGSGTGAGGGGQGGGGGTPTVKLAGEISSAKDYPRASRKLRLGAAVVIDLGVGRDGSVRSCRVVQASPDSAADRITCELATRRFRFRPARDATGNPVEATYRWRQRWFN